MSDVSAESRNAEVARHALEIACAGKQEGAIEEFYAPTFVDHVNAMTYNGTAGAHQSVALYLELFPDLEFVVEDQVTEGDQVASRWTLHGTHRGRRVSVWGIVISRLDGGQIVEDWAATDSLALARQLGVWRSVLLVLNHWRLLRSS
jgi:predicted ester cyclase